MANRHLQILLNFLYSCAGLAATTCLQIKSVLDVQDIVMVP